MSLFVLLTPNYYVFFKILWQLTDKTKKVGAHSKYFPGGKNHLHILLDAIHQELLIDNVPFDKRVGKH